MPRAATELPRLTPRSCHLYDDTLFPLTQTTVAGIFKPKAFYFGYLASIFFAISTGSPTGFEGSLDSLRRQVKHAHISKSPQQRQPVSQRTKLAGSTHVQVSFCHAEAKSASCCANGGGLGSALQCPSHVVPLYVPFTMPRVMQTAYGSPFTLLTLRFACTKSTLKTNTAPPTGRVDVGGFRQETWYTARILRLPSGGLQVPGRSWWRRYVRWNMAWFEVEGAAWA
eukprot:COSAG02_NODE_8105_length_2708_cov_1.353009_2_plen_226_part_00